MLHFGSSKYNVKYYSSIIFIILLIGLIMILNLDANIVFYYASGISPFPRDQYEEAYCYEYKRNDTIDSDCLKYYPTLPIGIPVDIPIDITDISYFSNGETFNATLWLNSPLYDNKYSHYVSANLSFIANFFNIERPNDKKLTHSVKVYPKRDGNWTYELYETHPYEFTNERLIDSINNYNNLIHNGKKFVPIQLDLNTIGNPEQFGVQFEMKQELNHPKLNFKEIGYKYLNDMSFWDTIPPRYLLIIPNWPSDIKVHAGEELKEKSIIINALGLNAEMGLNLTDGSDTDGINLSFDPSLITLPVNGSRETKMTVKTSNDLQSKIYNDIRVNSTTGFLSSNSSKLILPTSESETIKMEILPSLTVVDKINNFLIHNYGLFIIPLGITTIFAILLSNRFNQQVVLDKIGIQDILTIDGSVIVGVLVFLSLGSEMGVSNLKETFTLTAILTSTIVFPFALSALITLIKGSVEIGIKLAIPGFIYLMISIVLIAYIQYQSSI